MTGESSRFTSDRRARGEASWDSDEDWAAGTVENVEVIDGNLVSQPASGGEVSNRLAYGTRDDYVYVHNTVGWGVEQTLSEASNTVYSVVFSPDGSLLAYASVDDKVYVHNTTDWGLVETLAEAGGRVNSVAFAPL